MQAQKLYVTQQVSSEKCCDEDAILQTSISTACENVITTTDTTTGCWLDVPMVHIRSLGQAVFVLMENKLDQKGKSTKYHLAHHQKACRKSLCPAFRCFGLLANNGYNVV